MSEHMELNNALFNRDALKAAFFLVGCDLSEAWGSKQFCRCFERFLHASEDFAKGVL